MKLKFLLLVGVTGILMLQTITANALKDSDGNPVQFKGKEERSDRSNYEDLRSDEERGWKDVDYEACWPVFISSRGSYNIRIETDLTLADIKNTAIEVAKDEGREFCRDLGAKGVRWKRGKVDDYQEVGVNGDLYQCYNASYRAKCKMKKSFWRW